MDEITQILLGLALGALAYVLMERRYWKQALKDIEEERRRLSGGTRSQP